MPIIDIYPMLNMYQKSKDYKKPFGITVVWHSGETKSFAGMPENVLCLKLTKKQRVYAEKLVAAIKERSAHD